MKVLPVLALAIGLGACSGTTGESAADRPVVTVPGASTTAAGDKSCEARQITTGVQNEGACMLGRTRLVAVNGHSVLRLKTLSMAIRRVAVAEQIPGRHGESATPQNGAFMLITLMVKNRDTVAHRFDWRQSVLEIGDQDYEESEVAARRVNTRALAFAGAGKIPPGGLRQGELVFDISAREVEQATQRGRVFAANFGANPLDVVASRSGEVGFIRLYR